MARRMARSKVACTAAVVSPFVGRSCLFNILGLSICFV